MVLKDFLCEMNTGRVTSVAIYAEGDDYGITNYSEGKYFTIDTTWEIKKFTGKGFFPEMPEYWFDKDIIALECVDGMLGIVVENDSEDDDIDWESYF